MRGNIDRSMRESIDRKLWLILATVALVGVTLQVDITSQFTEYAVVFGFMGIFVVSIFAWFDSIRGN